MKYVLMSRMKYLILMGAAVPALIEPGTNSAEWPNKQDIVRAEPVALSPLAEGRLDVTRYLLVRGAGSFALSGDGSRVAYLSDVTGVPQIWVAKSGGGFPDQLTYGHGVDWLEQSPDGLHILYGSDSDGDERVAMNLLSFDGGSERLVVEKSAAFRIFGGFDESGARFTYASTERNGTDFDVHVAEVSSGRTRRVYEGRFGFFPQDWQPAGDLVLVRETRGETANHLHLLNVLTGELSTIFEPERASAYYATEWLPDGSGFFLATNAGGDFTDLAFYDVSTRRLRQIAAPGHDIAQVELSHDGRFLAYTTIETGIQRLRVRDLQTGSNVRVPELPVGTLDIQFAPAAPVLGIRVNGPRAPGEIHVWNLRSGATSLAVPTDSPGLDIDSMAIPEPVAFRARDGVTLTGLLYLPATALGGGLPPVYLSLHGGPSSYAMPTFRPDLQYYVSRGIAVLDLNYRGSTAHGRSFAELNDRELKANEPGDIADAVAWLRSTGRIDPDRIAVGGGSYGGYLTNLVLGTYPDMFVAGVSLVGVSDWVSALEGASPSLKASDRLEFGDISDPDVRAFFARLSPINYAERIRTPLMVLHGANDPRDPVTESDRLVQKIRAAGGEVTYLRFADEGHGISRLANRVHAYRRIATFLEEKFTRSR